MHIFRWLMSHPIITAWILAALAILLNINMGAKNSHDDAEQGEAKAAHVIEETAVTSAEHSNAVDSNHRTTDADHKHSEDSKIEAAVSTEKATSTIEAEEKSTEKVASEKAEETKQNIADVNQSTEDAQTKAIANFDPSKVVAAVTANSNVANGDGEKNKAPVEGEVSPSNTDQNKEDSGSLSLDAMSPEDLLRLAREAFWQNEKDKSASIYQALVQRVPSSLAYKGELANVLWHQNKQKESAEIYAEIAMPMLKQGKAREVGNMLGFIGVFFPEKAREIHRSMSE